MKDIKLPISFWKSVEAINNVVMMADTLSFNAKIGVVDFWV